MLVKSIFRSVYLPSIQCQYDFADVFCAAQDCLCGFDFGNGENGVDVIDQFAAAEKWFLFGVERGDDELQGLRGVVGIVEIPVNCLIISLNW